MTSQELKQALVNRKPVIFKRVNGDRLEYAYISGIIYRMKNGKLDVSAEKKRYRTSAFATPSNTFTGIRTRTVMKILQKQSGT